MTLAFSTLGCAGEPLGTVLDLARRHDVGGLELRAATDEFTHVGLNPAQRRELRERIEAAGLEILAVDSYVRLCAIEEQPFDAHLELAADLGAGGVRVFLRDDDATEPPDGPTPGELRAMDRISRAAKASRILVETHDSHSSGRRVAAFCRLLDREVPGHDVRVIWDAAHTWRTGEAPAASFALLRPWLEFVQIKDTDSRQAFRPVPIGTGDYPIAELLAALDGTEYRLSLEWERKWHPDLPPLDEALTATREWLAR